MFSSKSLLKGNLIGIRFIAENKKNHEQNSKTTPSVAENIICYWFSLLSCNFSVVT